MKLHNVGSNQTQISLDNGTEIFFSYNTPVAAFVPGIGYVKTEKKWSVTTSKHITMWIGRKDAPTYPQSYFDSLANGN